MLYAIVDIETTGSYALGNGITEIAIAVHDGAETLSTWSTLINPHRSIPRIIQQLTGITDDMVENAPAFEEVADTIHELLKDKIFVAHNVNFDYSFVKHHLERCGFELHARKLCTVRLARKIIPGYKSYSLGKICHTLSIPHHDHHRATGDTAATALLFGRLVAEDSDGVIAGMLKGRNSEQYLPPNVPVEQLHSLPECPGVYYFYNAAGKIIYIGKAINLHKRVKSHFSNNKTNRQKQDFLRETYRITYQTTATDLMAHILESVEIRRLWPVHNRSQKGYHPKFGLFIYEDRQGFKRLALDNNKQHFKPLHTFNTIHEGTQWLRQLQSEFGLCPRLCNMAKEADCMNGNPAENCQSPCPAHNDPDSYNERISDAMQWMANTLPTITLVDVGRNEDEQSCLLIEKGIFYGMGYISRYADVYDLDSIRKALEPYADNDYIRNLIYKHATEHPWKCAQWTANGEPIPMQRGDTLQLATTHSDLDEEQMQSFAE